MEKPECTILPPTFGEPFATHPKDITSPTSTAGGKDPQCSLTSATTCAPRTDNGFGIPLPRRSNLFPAGDSLVTWEGVM